MPKILKLSVGDILEMKKNHPCGANRYTVMRVGSDVRIVCCGCARDITMPREKLERAVKKVISNSDAGSGVAAPEHLSDKR